MSERVASPDELDREQARQAYAASIRLLARRDHSVSELTQKLTVREHGPRAIEAALEELIEANYVNDRRYAELYAEQRMNHGYGPLSIWSKLNARGIDSPLVQDALNNLEVDWCEHAANVISKRFTGEQICDSNRKTMGKIARFLQSRGFSSGVAFKALSNVRHAQG